MVKRGDMLSVDDVCDILSINLIGVVPDDEHIVISTNQGEPLVGSNCLAGKAYECICQRVLGEDIPLMDLDKKSFMDMLKGLFKSR